MRGLHILVLGLIASFVPGMAQTAAPAKLEARPTPPARDPHAAGYVSAKELPDGAVPPADADGNFIIGPTHNPAPELPSTGAVVNGKVIEFTMSSADSKI